MKRFKNLSLVLALAMVLQILVPVNLAYADEDLDEGIMAHIGLSGIITIIDPVTNAEIKPVEGVYQDVPKNAKIKIKFEFTLPDGDEYEFGEDDYFSINFPKEIKFKDITKEEFKSDDIDFNLNLERNTATVTIDRISGSNISGFFEIDGTFDESLLSGGKITKIDLGYEGGIINIGFKEPPKPDVDLGIQKNGNYNNSDDTITWTITVSTPSAIAHYVTINDNLLTKNHEYVAGSFMVNGITTSAAITGSILSYTFPFPVDTAQTITYKTKPTEGAFTQENGTNSKVIFKNKADLYLDGKFKADSPGIVQLDWINKSNGVISYIDGVPRIKWTVTVNNHGGKIDNSNNARIEDLIGNGLSLVVGDITITFDKNSPVKLTDADTNNGKYSYSENKLTYYFGNTNFETAVLTYYTDIIEPDKYLNSNSAITFNNTANLLWDNGNLGDPSDTSKATIGAGGLLNKKGQNSFAYINGVKDKITWTVEINRNLLTIANAVFTDIIPDGLEYIEGSFKVNGSSEIPVLTVTGSSIMYEFANTINTKQTITYETKILNSYKELFLNGGDGNNSVTFKNSAVIKGEIDNVDKEFTGTATQDVKTQVINKTVVEEDGIRYNYETGKVKWKIVINRNKMPLKNAVLTDTIPEGMSYVEGTFNITPTPTAIDGKGFEIKDNVITYVFPEEISDEYIVTFETLVSKDFLMRQDMLNKAVLFENKSILVTDFGEAKSNATVNVNNYIIKKEKDYVSDAQDYITWSIPINAGRVTLKDIEISDTLQSELELDLSSVKLYKANVDSKNGKLVKDGAAIDLELYKVTYENNIFTFKLHGTTSDSYILEFGTDVLVSKASVKNSVEFKGSGLVAKGEAESFSVSVDESNLGASGETGSMKIIKIDYDTEEKITLQNAGFKIYRIFNSNVIDVKRDATKEGEVLFDKLLYKTYYIEEETAPYGYLRDGNVHSIRVSRDDRDVEYTFRNKKALADIELIKQDENQNPIEGVEFTLSKIGDEDWKPITITSDEDGIVKFTGIELGKYKIEETYTVTGYKPIDKEIYVEVMYGSNGSDQTETEVKFTDKNGQEYDFDEELIIINELVDVSADVVINKEYEFDKAPTGAEFGLYKIDSDEALATATEEDGKVIFKNIPPDEYVIREISAPKGYLKTNTEIFVKVFRNSEKLDEALVSYRFEGEEASSEQLTIVNEAIKIEFIKKNQAGNPLDGAEFTLYDSDGVNPVEGFEPVVSNDFGEVIFTAVPEGSYIIKETKAPSGYRNLNKDILVTVVVNDNNVVEINFSYSDESEVLYGENSEFIVENERRPGGGGSDPVLGKIAIKKTDGNKKVLSGAEFTLYDEDGKVVDRGVSGSDGTLSFDNLKYGTYVIKETKAPEGYIITVDEKEVVINSTAVRTFTFTNKKEEPEQPEIPDPETPVVPSNGKITINKVDENNMALAGAEFTLYNENNEVLRTAVSDESGRVIFENLKDGKYFVRETKAPEGYEIVSDALTVNIAEGKSNNYRFRNVPTDTEIEDPNIPSGWEEINDPDVPVDTTAPTLPNTGYIFNTWMLAAIGFIFIFTGMVLFKRRVRN